MMMKNAQDGTIEGTAKHAAGQIHTRSLLHTCTYTLMSTHRDILHTHTYAQMHTKSTGGPQQVQLVLCARDRHVGSIHHT